MRAREFVSESKTGTITRDVGLALPGAYKIPALKNQDPYLQYRFGVAIAGAKGAAQRAKDSVPEVAPANNTNWFYSVENQVDIMVNFNGAWYGYRNKNYDASGFPTSGTNFTDPNGPICQATQPTTQSDGTDLVYGDIWIDTSDLENYPVIYRWQLVSGVDQWVLLNNTDQISSTGVLFQDARWAGSGTIIPADDPIPTIQSLLTSNYLDLDAPSASLYPSGMILWNTRRSGYNVKQFRTNYFNSVNFPDTSLPTETIENLLDRPLNLPRI